MTDAPRRLLFVGVLLLILLPGCRRPLSNPFLRAGREGPVTIEVVNNHYNDVDVYAIVGEQPIRLGTVTGKTTSRLLLDEDRLSGAWGLRLRADPIGSRERYTSPEVMVSPGDRVVLEVGAELRMSHVSLRM